MPPAPTISRRRAASINLIFGVLGIAVSILNGFLLVPLYLSHFSVATYGAWLASGGALSLIAIVDSGIAIVATQRLGKAFGSNDRTQFARESGTSIAVTLVIASLVFLICLPIAVFSPYWFSCPERDITGLQYANSLSAVRVALTIIMYTVGAIPQALQRAGIAGAVLLGAQLLGIVVTVTSLWLGFGVISLGVGQLTIAVVMVIGYAIQVPLLFREFRIPRISFCRKAGSDLLRDASALFLAKISTVAGDNVEPALVAAAVSPEMAVAMTQTGKFAKLVPMFQNRVASAVFAGLSMQAGRSKTESRRILLELLRLIIVSTFILLMCVYFLTPFLIELWLSAELFAGKTLLMMMVTLALGTIIRDISASFLLSEGQASWTGKVLSIDAPLRIGLLAVLTPAFGVYGIASSFLISTLVVGALVFRRLLIRNGISVNEIALMSASSVAAVTACTLAVSMISWAPSTLAGVGIAATAIAIMSLGIVLAIDTKFRQYLGGFFNRAFRKRIRKVQKA